MFGRIFAFKFVFNRLCCHGNYENVKLYLSIKFQLVSCNFSLAMIWQMIWQMTYTHKLPKLCSAALKDLTLKITNFGVHGSLLGNS